MTAGERFAFWSAEMAKCVRCYACRQVCPLCVCERCVADKSEPQWIENSPQARGNLSWHLTRAHASRRPLRGLRRVRARLPGRHPAEPPQPQAAAHRGRASFDYVVSDDPGIASPIGAFRQDDHEEFIK